MTREDPVSRFLEPQERLLRFPGGKMRAVKFIERVSFTDYPKLNEGEILTFAPFSLHVGKSLISSKYPLLTLVGHGTRNPDGAHVTERGVSVETRDLIKVLNENLGQHNLPAVEVMLMCDDPSRNTRWDDQSESMLGFPGGPNNFTFNDGNITLDLNQMTERGVSTDNPFMNSEHPKRSLVETWFNFPAEDLATETRDRLRILD